MKHWGLGFVIGFLAFSLQAQGQKGHAWEGSVELIYKHKNQIAFLYEAGNPDHHIDSLNITRYKDLERVKLELFSTEWEYHEGIGEPVSAVTGSSMSILDLEKVEIDNKKGELILSFREEVPRNTNGELIQIYICIKDPRAAIATAAAFRHLWHMAEKYREQEHNAGTCDF